MAAVNEKRYYERSNFEAPIMFSNYMSCDYSMAEMLNCSVDGMYFESETPLLPKEDICIKKANINENSFDPDNKEGYRAEVMWCKEIGNTDSRYGIGVQFYDVLVL